MVFRSRSGLNSNLLPPVNFIYQAAFVEKLRLQPCTVVQIINDFAFSISRLRSNRSLPLRENNTSQKTGQADTLIEDEYLLFGTRYLIVNISSCLQVGKQSFDRPIKQAIQMCTKTPTGNGSNFILTLYFLAGEPFS